MTKKKKNKQTDKTQNLHSKANALFTKYTTPNNDNLSN